jgi:hypothetical protein
LLGKKQILVACGAAIATSTKVAVLIFTIASIATDHGRQSILLGPSVNLQTLRKVVISND